MKKKLIEFFYKIDSLKVESFNALKMIAFGSTIDSLKVLELEINKKKSNWNHVTTLMLSNPNIQ